MSLYLLQSQTGFVTRALPKVEHELSILLEYLSSPPVFNGIYLVHVVHAHPSRVAGFTPSF